MKNNLTHNSIKKTCLRCHAGVFQIALFCTKHLLESYIEINTMLQVPLCVFMYCYQTAAVGAVCLVCNDWVTLVCQLICVSAS